MKYSLRVALITLLFLSFGLHAQDTELDEPKSPTVTIGADPIFVLLGAFIPSVEVHLSKRASISGFYGFGDLWFVTMHDFYGGQFRFYTQNDQARGMFAYGDVAHMDLEYQSVGIKLTAFGGGVGYRWTPGTKFIIEGYSGLQFSGEDKVTFTQQSGNVTKTVDIGGPVRFNGGLRLGLVF